MLVMMVVGAGFSSSIRWARKGGWNSHDHLLAGKQWVANELARPESDLGLRHDGDICRDVE